MVTGVGSSVVRMLGWGGGEWNNLEAVANHDQGLGSLRVGSSWSNLWVFESLMLYFFSRIEELGVVEIPSKFQRIPA